MTDDHKTQPRPLLMAAIAIGAALAAGAGAILFAKAFVWFMAAV